MNVGPLHPHRVLKHCPRCGAEGFAPRGENVLTCASCLFRFYLNAAAAVDVIVVREGGLVLLTRRAREPRAGLWDLPGGFVGMEESVEDAARRELREEVGLAVGPMTWFGSFPNRYEYAGLLYHTIDLVFVARVGRLTPRPGDDVGEARWADVMAIDLENDLAFDSTREALRRYRENLARR